MGPAATRSRGAGLTASFVELGVAIVEHALTPADLTQMDAIFPTLPERTGGARAAALP